MDEPEVSPTPLNVIGQVVAHAEIDVIPAADREKEQDNND